MAIAVFLAVLFVVAVCCYALLVFLVNRGDQARFDAMIREKERAFRRNWIDDWPVGKKEERDWPQGAKGTLPVDVTATTMSVYSDKVLLGESEP